MGKSIICAVALQSLSFNTNGCKISNTTKIHKENNVERLLSNHFVPLQKAIDL